MVVAAMEANGLRIVAADEAAWALGLRPGEPLARARARINVPIRVYPADPPADAAALDRLCLWAKRYTPTVAAFGAEEGRDGFFLDIAGASHLFGNESALLADLARRLAANGLAARVAVANTPGCAFALSRHGRGGGVAPGAEAQALQGLDVAALRLAPGQAESLRRLGLRRIGDLAGAPRAPLARRFGENLLLRLDQALGRRPEPLVALEEPHAYFALRGFLDPIARQETIVATATRLMESLTPRLEAAGLGARRLDLTLFRIDGQVRSIGLSLSVPTRCAHQVGRLLDLRLDRLGPALDAGFGFETVRLDVAATGPMRASQIPLVAGGPDAAETGHLVDALRQRIGPSPVRLHPVARHIPERAETARPWKAGDGTGWVFLFPPKADTEKPTISDGRRAHDTPAFKTGRGLADSTSPLDEVIPSLRTPATGPLSRKERGPVAGPLPTPCAEEDRKIPLGPLATMQSKTGANALARQQSSTIGRPPPRPLVLLGRGEAAEDVIALVPDGPPQRFRWRRQVHRIAHAEGPERIADEWWRAPAPPRDYYVVEDEMGRRLWVYREGLFSPQTPVRWFVHGLFA